MPIKIYERNGFKESGEIAWLCDDSWSLSEQMSCLEHWLKKEGKNISTGSYVADIGICARRDFSNGVGGGVVFSSEAMAIMSEKGIDLFLSEYPDEHSEI